MLLQCCGLTAPRINFLSRRKRRCTAWFHSRVERFGVVIEQKWDVFLVLGYAINEVSSWLAMESCHQEAIRGLHAIKSVGLAGIADLYELVLHGSVTPVRDSPYVMCVEWMYKDD
jgi:hypothetical protein